MAELIEAQYFGSFRCYICQNRKPESIYSDNYEHEEKLAVEKAEHAQIQNVSVKYAYISTKVANLTQSRATLMNMTIKRRPNNRNHQN